VLSFFFFFFFFFYAKAEYDAEQKKVSEQGEKFAERRAKREKVEAQLKKAQADLTVEKKLNADIALLAKKVLGQEGHTRHPFISYSFLPKTPVLCFITLLLFFF